MIHEILKILDTTNLQELEKQRITTDLLHLFNISNCCELIINKAWDLYCREAGMCAGAVDYWEQVSVEVQNIYICKIIRDNNC